MPNRAAEGPCRVLVLGAHPDDAEIFAGGLIVRHCRRGSDVKIVSVTDGRSGHHEVPPEELVAIRRREASASGRRVGADYVTWDFHDGALEPTLAVREAIIREIRSFQPDLVLTHRACDYHPDHRAVGTAVQDASYLVTVPHVCPDVPALRQDPVVASMTDLFTRPNCLRADVVLDVTAEADLIVQMASEHQSQFFQWLPYHDGRLDEVPEHPRERLEWLSSWFASIYVARSEHFRDACAARGIDPSAAKLEVYELSEYASQPSPETVEWLFPSE